MNMDYELIFWIASAIVAWVGIAAFLTVGNKVWGD